MHFIERGIQRLRQGVRPDDMRQRHRLGYKENAGTLIHRSSLLTITWPTPAPGACRRADNAATTALSARPRRQSFQFFPQ